MFQATNINKLKSNSNKKDGKFFVYRLFFYDFLEIMPRIPVEYLQLLHCR
jgi:hypothetical protein